MICLLGGTFDPVHVGHVHAALRVVDALGLKRIHLLLSARPGHRGGTSASVAHRWRMLTLACAGDARLVADDTEMRRAEREGTPSYTVETLEELREARADAVVDWVVGSDAYRELTTWHRWREVLDLANLVVLNRPGAPLILSPVLDTLTRERRVEHPPGRRAGDIFVLDAPMLPVSATQVRQALARSDGGVADLLPPAVYTYIKEHHLYGVVSDP